MVTLHEAAVESIFAQSGFADPIDLRIGPTIQYVAPDLLNLSSETEFNLLKNDLLGLPNTTVRLFFVDTISWCGASGAVAGCADSAIAVFDSADAANSGYGDELIAHELGHVFGLDHTDGDNLMNRTIKNGRNALTLVQITDLLVDSNVLYDINNKPFVNISPVLVVAAATAVPLPGAALLMLGALLPLGAVRRRRA
tara:strand:+ start:21 stop:611 length:591 start_codon:yes stop_codon:yes gene_type:complete